MPFKDMEVGQLQAIFVQHAAREGDVCVWRVKVCEAGGECYLQLV